MNNSALLYFFLHTLYKSLKFGNNLCMGIGARIKKVREKFGTQDVFSKELRVTRNTVANWETERATVPIGMLVKIAEMGGVSVDYLATGHIESHGEETTEDEKRLLNGYRALEKPQQSAILNAIFDMVLGLKTKTDK